MYQLLRGVAAAMLLALIACSPTYAKPYWGYNAVEGACPVYSWNASGTDCADSTKMNQQRFALAGDRPAVYRMRAQYNVCEAYIAVGQDCFKFFDKSIAWAAQHNQKVLLVVTQSNNAGADYNGYRFPQTTTELARYKEWWKKLTIKYGNDSRVIGAEVWNEPNGNTLYTGGLTIGPTEYAKAACAALNGRNEGRGTTGNPRLKLYLGALAWNTSGITPTGSTPFPWGSWAQSPSTHMAVWTGRAIQALTAANGCPNKTIMPIPAGALDEPDTDKDWPDGISLHVYNNVQIDWATPFGLSPARTWLTAGTAPNPCENDAVTGYEQVNGCNLAMSVLYHLTYYVLNVVYQNVTAGEVLVSELGYLTAPLTGQPGASPQSQRWAYRYIRTIAKDYLNGYYVRGIYFYPLRSNGGDNGTNIDQTGMWRSNFTANPSASEFVASLQDQINNPTAYP